MVATLQNQTKFIWGAVFIILAMLFLLDTIVTVRNNTSLSIEDTVGDATIYFSTNHQRVLLPTDCVMLAWDVEGIQSVYLGESGVNGQGSSEWCLSEGKTPYLHVNFTNGTSKQYQLPLGYSFNSLSNVYAGLCFIIALYLFRVPLITHIINSVILHENRLSYLISAWIIVIMYIYWAVNGQVGLSEFTHFTHELSQNINEYFTAPWQG